MVSMKIIVHPGSRTDEYVFNEDCTVQDVRKKISDLLQFIGSRSPDPQNFKMWQIHPRRELAKPLLTLRQMQVPRDCALLVLPPDVTPPSLSSLDDLNHVLSSLNFNTTRNNTDNQRLENNDVPNQNGNVNPTAEESAPRENGARKRKSKNEKTKVQKNKNKEATTDEPFLESKQYCCKICLKNFGSKRAVRAHHTRIHKKSKDATTNITEGAHGNEVQPVLAVSKDHEEPKKKKAKENKNDVNIKITVNNTVNYNYFGLGRGDFY